MTAEQRHVVPITIQSANEQVLWQPVIGPETSRLLLASKLDVDAQGNIVTQAVDVLARCSSPSARGVDRTGLVVGYVQSGKTLSFTTVISLARDNGFPLVILLAGTKENLHEQTVNRLRDDLEVQREGGLSPWHLLENPAPGTADVQSVAGFIQGMHDPGTPEMFRRVTVLAVMKNPTRLRRVRQFVEELEQYGVDLNTIPILVVDDEADQAGLNAAVARDDTTATYQGIVDLRQDLPHHSYVMYTATPQAPLLVNLADILSPDFVKVLEPGEGYAGGEYFFVEHEATFVKRMTSAAITEALDPGLVAPPDGLKAALATYFLVLAQRGKGPVSMLVHPSHTTELHDKYGRFAQALRTSWQQLLREDGVDRDDLVETWFVPAYNDLVKADPTIKPLDELLSQIPYWIGSTQVRVVNSGTPADSDIQWNAAPSWILVGGNKLDRGFTVEGLAVTFMPRRIGVGQVDTVQQRARFFGYKQSYGLLCRAWLSSATAEAFEHYVEHEQLLRRELQDVDRLGISLKDWTRMMILDPKYKPTRKAVIDLPFLHGRIPGDSWVSASKLGGYAPAGALNSARVNRFVDAHKSGFKVDDRDTRGVDTKHQQVTVSVETLLRDLLVDWRGHPDDKALVNQAVLLLRARLDDEPELQAKVYLMDGGRVRERSLLGDNTSVNNLQQGRGAAYIGDQSFYTPDRVSIQLHSIRLKKDGPGGVALPGLSLRVPSSLAGGVLVQYEGD